MVHVRLFSPLAPVKEVSPLVVSKFQAELCNHPDRSAVLFVLAGLRDGFRVGFSASSFTLKSASANML